MWWRWRLALFKQLTALKAFGIDVPKTIAVVGKSDLARSLPRKCLPPSSPSTTRAGRDSSPLLDDLESFRAYAESDEFEQPVDGITPCKSM